MEMNLLNTTMLNPYQQQAQVGELSALKDQTELAENKELKETCNQFESILLGFMLKEMRKTVNEEELFHGGQGEEMFRELQDKEVADEISKSEKIGLSEMLYKQLSREEIKINIAQGRADKKE